VSHVGIVAMSSPALGGTFQYTLSMIDALRRIRKNRYTIFTSAKNHSYDALGLPVLPLPSAGRTVIEIVRANLLGGERRLFSEVDKVIAPIYTTRLLASQRPFVFTLHDLQERYYPQNFTVAQRIWRGFANKSLSHAAAEIICESNYVRRDIHNFLGVSESKIAVIPAPPISEFSSIDPASAQFIQAVEEAALPEQFILYPAQFFRHKNHLRLAEAFALVLKAYPHCHLLLTGKRIYDFDKVMSRVAELGIQDRVRYLGFVDAGVLAAVYSRAKLVVIPTLFESISIPVYEAFRVGVPVCASNVVGLPEQIGDAGVLFDPLSISDMAEKICSLLGDADLRKDLIRRGKERISALTADWYAGQLENVLDRTE
jgi:glycosyltransferase involved in cell wall biosynthesis